MIGPAFFLGQSIPPFLKPSEQCGRARAVLVHIKTCMIAIDKIMFFCKRTSPVKQFLDTKIETLH